MRHFILSLIAMLFACSPSDAELQAEPQQSSGTMTINITIGGQTRTVALVDNAATRELLSALQQAPITYEADDYGGFEKVGPLGRSLPTSNQQLTTEAGDVILYSGNQVVLFYGSNSWSYTRLGRIQYETLGELKSFLKAGEGRISVTLSLPGTTSVGRTAVSGQQPTAAYNLQGHRVGTPAHGVFIKNGRKVKL